MTYHVPEVIKKIGKKKLAYKKFTPLESKQLYNFPRCRNHSNHFTLKIKNSTTSIHDQIRNLKSTS